MTDAGLASRMSAMLAETVLALMLTVGPRPGLSPYSVTPTAETAKPCEGFVPLCRRPWLDDWWGGLVRQETYAEGLFRYWTIAQTVATVAGDDDRLTRLLLTVTLHESGWRRDIHAGRGKLAIGDEGRSFCIVQARLGRGSKAGYQLVGVSPTATKRCLRWGARHLRRCSRGTATQAFSCYGGVSNGAAHPGIAARVESYQRFTEDPKPLPFEVRELLGLATPTDGGSAK
jgi:hypothetical protein